MTRAARPATLTAVSGRPLAGSVTRASGVLRRAQRGLRDREPPTGDGSPGVRAGLEEHLGEACLGTVSEVFDGDAPPRPGGAPAQAWSVSELLRVLLVELAPR
jgi:hypothetical protein